MPVWPINFMHTKPTPPHQPHMSSTPRPDPTSTSAPQTQTPRRPIAFISGPLEADTAYFTTHYLPRIRAAADKGHAFLLGPSRGVDTLALAYLKHCGVPIARVRLYLNSSEETRLRGNFRRFEEAGGVLVIVKGGHAERDEMMTRASHYDILRYRTEEECRALYGEKYRARISGTQRNEMRRQSGVGLTFPIPAQPVPHWKVEEKEKEKSEKL